MKQYFTMGWQCLLILTVWLLLNENTVAEIDEETEIKKLLYLSIEELLEVPITTASKHEENIRNTPATVIVVTRQQIVNRHYVNLIDLLADLPGVDVQRVTEETRYHNITLRGHLGNNKFLILQDGIRIDSPTGEAIPIADNFPLYHAKQVEIVYGPAAALYGADAFGGVINIITEDAKNIDGASIATSLGSDGYRYHYVHAGKQLNDQIALVVGGHKHSAETADLSEYYPNDYAKVDATTFSGNTVVAAKDREHYLGDVASDSAFLKVNLGEHLTLGINHSYFRSLSSTGDKPSTMLFSEEAQWNTEINTGYGKYQFDLTDRLSGETIAEYNTYEVDPASGFTNIFVDFKHSYKYAKGRKRAVEQQLTYLFNDAQTLIGGLSYEDFYVLPKTADLPIPFDRDKPFNQQEMYYEGTDNTLPIQFLDVNYTNSAAYLQLQSRWNAQWSTVLGLRYDKNSRYESTLNPRLGLVYQPRTNTVIKLLYGEAFRAPAPVESLNIFGTFTGQKNEQGEYIAKRFRVPNLDLQPEKVRTVELHLNQTWQDNLNVFMSGYYTEVADLIETVTETTPSQFIPGGYIESSTIKDNLNKGQQWGIDLSLNYQRALRKDWQGSFWANYSFITGQLIDSQNNESDLPYIAQHKLKLGATLSYKEKYFITPQVYLIDRTNTNKPDPADAQHRLQAPGYALTNLHLGIYQLYVKGLSAQLDIENCFDIRYYNAGGITSNMTFVGAPQQPRTLRLSLRYQF